MTVKLIAAQSLTGVIGKDGAIPWWLPTDMAFFKRTTMGHTVVMGRKTFESIGRPLAGRRNLVLTRDRSYKVDGVEVFHTLSAVQRIEPQGHLFVIGGESLYEIFLQTADEVYLTIVDAVVAGDAFFPRINGDWTVRLLEAHTEAPLNRAGSAPWFPHRIYSLTRSKS